MKPFELFVELKTPIVLGSHPTRLDGLVWHCLFLESGCPDRAKALMKKYLYFDHDIFHASSLSFAIKTTQQQVKLGGEQSDHASKEHALIALTRSTIGSMKTDDLDSRHFKPFGGRKGDTYPKLMVDGGPYIARLREHKAYWSDGLVFHGRGDGKRIASLLEFYVGAVGVNANIGFGTIGSVSSTDIEEDISVVGIDSKPARPVPVNHPIAQELDQSAIEQAILTPPFRHTHPAQCYMPERVRIHRI